MKHVITINDKRYIYQQIIIVSSFAPDVRISIDSVDGSASNNEIVDNDILRICRLTKNDRKPTIITGFNKLKELKETGVNVTSMKLMTLVHLERALLKNKPPVKSVKKENVVTSKALDVGELQKKLLNANNGMKVTIGKQSKKPNVVNNQAV